MEYQFVFMVVNNIIIMYGRIPQRKINQEDFIMSCEKAREQLDEYINDESKRVNVDSAKKKAVLQMMDYEGFRQMVLGANIFPTKSKQLYQFSKGQSNPLQPNQIFTTHQPQHSQPIQLKHSNSEMHCYSFQDFKKKFNKIYQKQMNQMLAQQLYTLIKEQNQHRINKIFNTECQANILIKIIHVFDYVLHYLASTSSESIHNEASYIAKFMQTVLTIPTFKTLNMCILTKKQKNVIIEFSRKLKAIIPPQNANDIDFLIKDI